MKYIVTILLVIFAAFAACSQTIVGRQQVINLKTGDYGTPTSNGLLWLPDDYYTTTKKYPLIISCPGTGEQGTNLNVLITQYQLAGRIAAGWNPVSSNGTKFIVYTPQGPAGSLGWNAPHLLNFLTQLKAQYRIDSVYITGLSAGNWAEWKQLNDKTFANQVSAIAAISEMSIDAMSWMDAAGAKNIPVWFICGTADDKYSIHNKMYDYYKGKKIKTDLKGVGHSAWNQAYDYKWTDAASGNRNLFDWFLWVSNYKETVEQAPIITYRDSAGYIAHDSLFVVSSNQLINTRVDSVLVGLKPASSMVENGSMSIGFELEYDKRTIIDTIPAQKIPVLIKNFIHDTIYHVPVIK